MKNLSLIANDLFNKIRGRFPNVTIGDSDGTITNIPEDARFFDFSFTNEGFDLGKVSVSLDEKDGIVVIVGRDIAQNQMEDVQDRWYNFLKELRIFAKKRLLNFDVRDINKSNLTKRDYKFLATNRSGENNMAESAMYGTNKTSYQRIGNARLAIKHTESINLENTVSRSQKIGVIYIESPQGERFRYPYKHLSGARAMAQHVSEGGNQYDDFGKHIIGLSEELSKLRKFKTYMGRSSVMAESLAGYMDVVKERIAEVKKTIHNLQKPTAYKEAVESFEAAVYEDVPDDVAENWIDQLTIKQFNEELKDVFPYIYRLVSEATKAKALGPEDLDEAGKLKGGAKDPCWSGYQMVGTKKKGGREVPNCVPREEIELESGFDKMMGQFGEAENNIAVSWMEKHDPYIEYHINAANNALRAGNKEEQEKHKDIARAHRKAQIQWEMNWNDGQAETMSRKAIQASKETGADIGEASDHNFTPDDLQQLQKMDNVDAVKRRALELITTKSRRPMKPEKVAWFKRAIAGKRTPMDVIKLMYDLMLSGDGNAVIGSRGSMAGNSYRRAFGDDENETDFAPGVDANNSPLSLTPKKPKTPIGEFILSYFDRETGRFPKGETAVLTAVQKEYGDQYVKPAAKFVKRVESITMAKKAEEIQNSPYPETEMIKQLAGM